MFVCAYIHTNVFTRAHTHTHTLWTRDKCCIIRMYIHWNTYNAQISQNLASLVHAELHCRKRQCVYG